MPGWNDVLDLATLTAPILRLTGAPLHERDGAVIMIANVFGIIVQEIGITAEQGASYFSITAGLLI